MRARLSVVAGRQLTEAGWLIVTSQKTRSQERNRADALEKLVGSLAPSRPAPAPAHRHAPDQGLENAPARRARRGIAAPNPCAARSPLMTERLEISAGAANRRSMLRKLYDWTLSLAARKTAEVWLAIIAFIESSVFLVPADVLFLPMVLARPERAWRYALVATVASTLGRHRRLSPGRARL